MLQHNHQDEIHIIPLDKSHLLALVLSIVMCLSGGELLCLLLSSVKIALSFWQAFTLVAFLMLSIVCLYRGCLRLMGPRCSCGEKVFWHRDRDLVAAMLWLSVDGALLFTWIFCIMLPSSLCASGMAAFCLASLGALGRFIILLASPLSLDKAFKF